ncbi:MAG: hydroxypyruvate isomerase [Devosia sp.]|jgi:hydroxypyruvate isomerase|nr:hydroxypyruvate isomerase [Devosia sp.]
MRFSACLEMLFVPETADFTARIALARSAGFDLVEFWRWTNKDLDAVEAALRKHGVALSGIVAEPMIPLTDPTRHAEFLLGLEDSIAVAQRLGAPLLIAQAGNEIDGLTRAEQHDAIVTVLRRAAPLLERANIILALEPLNTLVDHAGYFLHSTAEGLDIVDAVGSRQVRLLYDIYHSAVMGENIARVLAGRLDRIAHVHLADAPGRNEPGSGDMDWQGKLDWLTRAGYRGPVGLEFRPTVPTVAALERVLSR